MRVSIAVPLGLAVALLQSMSAQGAIPPTVGFNVHLFNDATSSISTELDLADAAGANVVRVDVPWSVLEPTDNVYDGQGVARLTSIINQADARGIKVLAMVNSTPCWASKAPKLLGQCITANPRVYPPSNPNKYGEFARWLVDQYGQKLAGIEVWNEPNDPPNNENSNFASLTPAADYAKLVKATHDYMPAPHSSHPPVVAGALLADTDLSFMDQLFAQPGFSSSFEVWSVHAYALTGDADDVVAATRIRRNELASHGSTAPIWVDEFGWSTCSGCTPPEQQGLNLASTFSALATAGACPPSPTDLCITGAMSYGLRDDGTDSAQLNDNYGIVRRDYAPKPAFSVVQVCLTDGHC